jgi:xanthine dehydrogenase accessory factor
MEERILKQIYQSLASGHKAALVTITDIKGSIPRKKGSILLVKNSGSLHHLKDIKKVDF